MAENKSKGMDWMAAVFYPLSVILMEAFWVSPWLNWVGGWSFWRQERPVLSLASIVIVLAVSLVLTRIISRQKMPFWLIQFSIIGSGLIVMLLVMAAEYTDGYTFLSPGWFSHLVASFSSFRNPGTIMASLPVVIYLWWRGITLGQSTTFFKDIYRSFIIGMVMLIILIIIWQASGFASGLRANLGLDVIAFFFFGLLSIAICHLYVMRGTMPKEDAALTSVWRWMPVMLGVIGGMVLIGFALASIFSPDVFASISRGFNAVGGVLLKIFEYLMAPFIYLIAGIVWVIKWLLAFLRKEPPPDQEQEPGDGMPKFEDIVTKELPPWIGELFKWLIIAAVAGVVIFILAKAISRYRDRKAGEELDEVNESLFSWKGLRKDLKEWLNGFGDRFKRKPEGPVSTFDPNAAGRLDVREIFKHLQWEGKNSGVTRQRHETAAEYAYRLERAVPDSVEAIGVTRESIEGITERYEAVRYGDNALPEPEVDKANGFWLTVKAMLRKLRGEK